MSGHNLAHIVMLMRHAFGMRSSDCGFQNVTFSTRRQTYWDLRIYNSRHWDKHAEASQLFIFDIETSTMNTMNVRNEIMNDMNEIMNDMNEINDMN